MKGCTNDEIKDEWKHERRKPGLRKSYALDVRSHVFLFQASEM